MVSFEVPTTFAKIFPPPKESKATLDPAGGIHKKSQPTSRPSILEVDVDMEETTEVLEPPAARPDIHTDVSWGSDIVASTVMGNGGSYTSGATPGGIPERSDTLSYHTLPPKLVPAPVVAQARVKNTSEALQSSQISRVYVT